MSTTEPQGESTAEREGIVDQQGAALEKIEDDGSTHDKGAEEDPKGDND